jgi:hypothetical protein
VPAAQRLPQAPQLALSAARSTSQPLAALPSQSAKPGAQAATRSAEAAHAGVGVRQRQTDAAAAAVVRRVSSRGTPRSRCSRSPSQSPKPASQVTPHIPSQARPRWAPRGTPRRRRRSARCSGELGLAAVGRVAVAVAEARAALDAARAPLRSGRRRWRPRCRPCRSRRSAGCSTSSSPRSRWPPLPSQSARPGVARGHARRPRRGAGALPLAAVARAPQRPQLGGVFGGVDARARAAGRAGRAVLPQPPQCARSDWGSTQSPPQQASPTPQPRPSEQPGTHAPPRQRVPRAQSLSLAHPTQRRLARSQRVGAVQSSSPLQAARTPGRRARTRSPARSVVGGGAGAAAAGGGVADGAGEGARAVVVAGAPARARRGRARRRREARHRGWRLRRAPSPRVCRGLDDVR